MPTGLGLSGKGQDRGREGEHTVRKAKTQRERCGREGAFVCHFNITDSCLFTTFASVVCRDLGENRFVYYFHDTSCVCVCVSFSTLCDNLRRERDRAVSDLADALRNLDDMRKQKNDSVRELKELK